MNNFFDLTYDSYKIVDPDFIIIGSYGCVRKVQRKSDGNILAMKSLNRGNKNDLDLINTKIEVLQWERTFLKEYALSGKTYVENSYILPLFDYGEYNNAPAMIFPFCEQDLEKIYRESEKNYGFTYAPSDLLRWIKQISIALDYLHDKNVNDEGKEYKYVHRDLKPKNIVLWNNDAFLIDFGTLKKVPNDGTLTFGGNHVWPAPELFFTDEEPEGKNGKNYYRFNTMADMYSLGLIIFALITGQLPDCQKKIHQNIDVNRNPFSGVTLSSMMPFEGLTKKESNLLRKELLILFQRSILADRVDETLIEVDNAAINEDDPTTLLYLNSSILPDYQYITDIIIENVNQLLSFNASNRPSAENLIDLIEYIENLLSPDIDRESFQIQSDSDEYYIGDSIILTVHAHGRGIPDHTKWLKLKIDNTVIDEPSSHNDNTWTYKIKAFQSIEDKGKKNISASAYISKPNMSLIFLSQKTINIKAPFIQLWNNGNYDDAIDEIGNEKPQDKQQTQIHLSKILVDMRKNDNEDMLITRRNIKLLHKIWNSTYDLSDIENLFAEYLWKVLKMDNNEIELLENIIRDVDQHKQKRKFLSEEFYNKYFKNNLELLSFV